MHMELTLAESSQPNNRAYTQTHTAMQACHMSVQCMYNTVQDTHEVVNVSNTDKTGSLAG